MTISATALSNIRERLSKLCSVSREGVELVFELLRAGYPQEAIVATKALSLLPGGNAAEHEALGFAAFSLGLHNIAKRHYAMVVERAPADPQAWYNYASSQRNMGELREAEVSCNRALALSPGYTQAALLRSHLRVQTHDDNHILELRNIVRTAAQGTSAWIFAHYALGKELDDIGEYAAAFASFTAGAAARRHSLQYDVRQDVAKLQRIRESFSEERLRARCVPAQPCRYGFIIGLPRSGTTLVERVLTRNPLASSNGETDNLIGALLEGTPETGGDIFDRVAQADAALVRASYERRAGVPREGGVLLEKLPMNYLYAGAIALTLSDAKMLLVKRHIIDNCFGMFVTLFGAGYPFTYAWSDLAAYANEYLTLLRHWEQTLGDRLLSANYDELVRGPSTLGPQLATHLGLSWSPEMIHVEKNRSATATASAAQVRRPIYQSSSGRWRNYERYLTPLIDGLVAGGAL